MKPGAAPQSSSKVTDDRRPEQEMRNERGVDGSDHGRSADSPAELPPKGWRDVLFRVKEQAKEDNVTLLGAGIAFFSLLSLFPALAALISIYGLVADPADVSRQVDQLGGTVPAEARQILTDQLQSVASTGRGALGAGVVVGIVLALWSASAAVKHLLVAMSIAYDEDETRGYVKLRGSALALTVAGLVFVTIALFLLTALPDVARNTIGDDGALVVSVLRWPVLLLMMVGALSVIYRYGPDRDQPRWRWVSWGAGFATVLWLLACVAFSFYSSHFGTYNKTYGAMGSVIILMLWLYITTTVVIVGAEINAELEHQTTKDSTVGRQRPLGDRDAYVADTVGHSYEEARSS